MKAELPLHAPGTQLDRGYIGQSVPRPNAARLLQGRGAFVDDLRFPRLAHVVFFRSPHAHARIRKLSFSRALKSEGAVGIFSGRDIKYAARVRTGDWPQRNAEHAAVFERLDR